VMTAIEEVDETPVASRIIDVVDDEEEIFTALSLLTSLTQVIEESIPVTLTMGVEESLEYEA